MSDEGDLVVLAHRLSDAKRAENEAKKRRLEIEEAIVAATGFQKPEGQETFERAEPWGSCKLTLNQPITTAVNGERWEELRRKLPRSHPARAIFRTRYELDTRAARDLQNTNQAAWLDVCDAITRKPGKVSVELKEVTRSSVAWPASNEARS